MSFFNKFNSNLLSLIAKPKNKSTISRGFSSSLLDTELAIQQAFISVKDNLLISDEKLNDVYSLIQEGSTLYNLLLAANKFKLTYANLLVYILRTDKIYAPSVAQLIDIFTNSRIQAVAGKSINDLYLALIEEALFSFDPLSMLTSGINPEDPAKQEDTDKKLKKTINRLPVAKLSLEQLKYILSDTDKIRKANPEFIKSYEKYAQEHGYTLDDNIALEDNGAADLDKDDVSVLYLTALNYFYEMFAAYFISQGIKVDSFKLIDTTQNTVNKTNEMEVSLDAPAGTQDSGDEENRSYEESTAPDAAAPQEGVGYDNLTSGKGDTPKSLNKLVHTILDSIPSTKAALQNTLDTFHRLADQYYTSQVRTDVSQQSAWRNFVEQNKISNFIGGEEIKKLIPPDSNIFEDFVNYYRIKVNKIDKLEKEARYHTAVLSALTKRANYLQKEAKNEKRDNPRELKEPNYLSSVNKEIKSIRESINYFTSLLSNKETLELNTKAIQKRSEINQLRKQIDNTQEGPEKEQLIDQLQNLYQDYANIEKQAINNQQEADKSTIQNYVGNQLPGDKSAFANMSVVDLTNSLNKKREELSRLENEYNQRLDSFLNDTSNLEKTNMQIELHKEELANMEPQIEKLKETASVDVYNVLETYLNNRQERALQELGTYDGVPQVYIDQFNKIFDDKRKYLANIVVPSVAGGSKTKKTKEDRTNQITNKSIGDRSFSNLQATDLRHYVEAYKYIFFYYKEAADSQTETTSELTPELLEKHYSGEALSLLEKYMPSTTKKMNLWGNEVEVPAYNTEVVADKLHALVEKGFDSIVDPIDRLIALMYLNVVIKNVYSKNPELAKSFKEQAGYSHPKQDYSKKNPTKLTDAERILYNDINQLLKGAGDVGAQEKAELRILKNKIDAGENITEQDKAYITSLLKQYGGTDTRLQEKLDLQQLSYKLQHQKQLSEDESSKLLDLLPSTSWSGSLDNINKLLLHLQNNTLSNKDKSELKSLLSLQLRLLNEDDNYHSVNEIVTQRNQIKHVLFNINNNKLTGEDIDVVKEILTHYGADLYAQDKADISSLRKKLFTGKKLSTKETQYLSDLLNTLGANETNLSEKINLQQLQQKISNGEKLTSDEQSILTALKKKRIHELQDLLDGQETSRDKQIEYKKKLDNDMFMLYDTDNVREYKGKNYVQGPDNLWYRIIYLNDDKTQYNIAKRPTNLPDETQIVEDTDVGTATNTVPTQAVYTKPGAWMHITAQGNNFLGEREGFGGQVNENNFDNPTDVGLNMSTENLENMRNEEEIENPGVKIEEPKDVTLNQKPHKEFSIKDFGNFLKALRSSNPSAYGKILEISNQYTGDSSVNLPAFLNLLSSPELPGKDNPKATDAMEVYNRLTHNDYHRNTYQTVIKDKLIPALQNDPDIAALWVQFQSQEPLQ